MSDELGRASREGGGLGLANAWMTLWDTAASVAQTELAAWIRTAELMEQGLTDLADTASGGALGPAARLQRRVFDLFAEALTLSVTQSGVQGGEGKGSGKDQPKSGAEPSAELATILQLPGPLTPGQAGERVLELSNDGEEATGPLSLTCSDLISGSGSLIGAENVYVDPPALSVDPHSKAEVIVGARIPEGTASGTYEGLLIRAPEGGERIVVQVSVV